MIRALGAFATLLIVAVVVGIGVDLFIRGMTGFHARYLTEAPRDLGRAGGIGPILLSTGLIVGTATLLAGVTSLCAAVALLEARGRTWLQRCSQLTLNAGVGVPRIVWGLFGATLFGGILGLGFSVATGVLTLACMLAPLMTVGFATGLRAVDPKLAEQCAGLGATRWSTTWRQIVPAARPALAATTALAAGRGLGDAAALLFTSGVTAALPHSLFDPAATLAVHIFNLLASVPGGQRSAYAAAAVLFTLAAAVQAGIAALQPARRFAS